MAASKSYNGSCHCGSNTFSVTISPPLENPEQKVLSCNCSICTQNGYLLTFVPAANITWSKGGLANLTKYEFNKKNLQHYFCGTCGSSCAAGMGNQVGLNVRCLQNLDVEIEKLGRSEYDGRAL
ncbi:glutathione-dependent formaldehyde-activating enzyme [Tothia fuscella]|uniref:Glutathione-dependent formaldehyde-activating enzyme n=1 Tax=Tothia fuscella TaxID=1048955 RepID=A0A9P4NXL5_9PEZI|nr:glutathione-dependent formaldehyde-activating enzyme [Tothia fuscella]